MSYFKCIVQDPPWEEKGGGKIKRGCDRWYSTLKKEDILRVVLQAHRVLEFGVPDSFKSAAGPVVYKAQPVFNPDPEGCHLWTWATMNHLEDALWLIKSLGFRYVTHWIWVKADRADEDMRAGRPWYELERPGLGQYLQAQHELLLFGTMGKTMKPEPKDRPRSVIMAPRPAGPDGKSIHSAKPPEAWDQVIRKVSRGPFLELFAREKRGGPERTLWGDEAGGS